MPPGKFWVSRSFLAYSWVKLHKLDDLLLNLVVVFQARRIKDYSCIVPSATRDGDMLSESAYFLAPYVVNQLLCSLSGPHMEKYLLKSGVTPLYRSLTSRIVRLPRASGSI